MSNTTAVKEKLIIDLPSFLIEYSKIIENGCLVQLMLSQVEKDELFQIAEENNNDELKKFLTTLIEVDDNGSTFYAHTIETPLAIREILIQPNDEERRLQRRESRIKNKNLKKRKLDVLNGVIEDPTLAATIDDKEKTKLLESEKKKKEYSQKDKVKDNKKMLAMRTSKAIQLFKKECPETWKKFQSSAEIVVKEKLAKEKEERQKESSQIIVVEKIPGVGIYNTPELPMSSFENTVS